MAKAKKKASKKVSKKVQERRKPKAKAQAKKRSKHKFTVSHYREQDFDQGLRTYAKYRDLGIAPAVSTPHYHDVEFQMIYVLKGWIKSEFEGQGVHTFHAGSCWIQPPKIKHAVLGYSDDCELLEIVLPADFETVSLVE
jgi:hypothetical protein